MTLLAPSAGEVCMLNNLLHNAAIPENLLLKLYSNSKAPAAGDTAASYTEVSGGGYAAKTLTNGASWTTTSGTPSYSTYTAQTFNFTGTITTYGYFIVGATSGTIYWAEEIYPSGQTFNNGDSLTITPKITLT
jgi:hypothetical protein